MKILPKCTIQTGFYDIDRITTGLHNGNLIYIGSRPGIGKSSFALNIALNVLADDKTVAFFSLEMSEKQLRQRLIATEARINLRKVRNTSLCDIEETKRLITANDTISNLNFFIDDTPNMSVDEIETKLTQLGKVDLIIIDYFQLIKSSYTTDNPVEKASLKSWSLSKLAKALNIPILCLTQLPRTCENRENHRPKLCDLDPIGSLGQDADVFLFLYRESYYDEKADKTSAECIIAKNRNGERDVTVNLKWNWECMLFTSYK